jgi:hypothetical protein
MTFENLLQEVRSLSVDERKQLIKVLVDTLDQPAQSGQTQHSLRELRGLGKEIWQGIDAQEYINQLRDEWDNRP